MLRQAQEVMDKGLMTPAEMEAHLVAHLTVRCSRVEPRTIARGRASGCTGRWPRLCRNIQTVPRAEKFDGTPLRPCSSAMTMHMC